MVISAVKASLKSYLRTYARVSIHHMCVHSIIIRRVHFVRRAKKVQICSNTVYCCSANVPGKMAIRRVHRIPPVSNSDIEDEVASFLQNGVVEWHTHWHGILDPFQYVNCWLPFAAVDKMIEGTLHGLDVRAGYDYARSKILKYYTDEDRNVFNDKFEKLPSPHRSIVRLLKDIGEHDKQDFTKHVLTVTTMDSVFENAVHWNLAYNFRRIIRDSVIDDDNEVYKHDHVPLETFNRAKDITKWLKVTRGTWRLDIVKSIREKGGNSVFGSDVNDVDNIIESVIKAADRTCEEYITGWKRTAVNSKLSIKPSLCTIKYGYARTIIREFRKPENNVLRAEISISNSAEILDKDPQASQTLFKYLCTQFPISVIKSGGSYNKDKRFTAKFLYSVKADDLTEVITHRTRENIKRAVMNEDILGIDVLGPEPTYDVRTTRENIEKIYDDLVESVHEYRKIYNKRDYSSKRRLIFRIHVGESNMRESEYDKGQAEKGRDNVYFVLTAIKALGDRYNRELVSIRLGHVSSMTIGQAYYMREQGIQFEVNSISNMRTRAVESEGHLPILKVLIADAIYLYKHKGAKSRKRRLSFTCNTDGNGIMKSSLKEEYELNLALVRSFVKHTALPNGKWPRVVLCPDRKYPDMEDSNVLKEAVNDDFKAELRDLEGHNYYTTKVEYSDFKPEVRDHFRATLGFFVDSHPSPSVYSVKTGFCKKQP